jgi:DNA relaxase NicK
MKIVPFVAPVVHSGVDWISMSCDRASGVAELLRWRDVAFKRLGEEGYSEQRFASHGFEGRSRGQVSVSVGRSSVLCSLSGVEAYSNWRTVAQHATNISRIDLACTVRPATRTSALAREGYATHEGRSKGRGRPVQLTLIQSQDRGDTLYVGSRKSDQLGRLYDKEKESKEKLWNGCWRYEVQYRREYAKIAAGKLAGVPTDAEACTATVSSWFSARGIPCVPIADNSAITIRPAPKVADDIEWLRWVMRCVQPRARELVKRYGWRFVAEKCVGRIDSYDQWETLLRDIELELEVVDDGGGI